MYIKKRASANNNNSNKPFVATAKALDANGVVLTHAMHGHPGGGGHFTHGGRRFG